MSRTLDTDEPQILLFCGGDDVGWHHRILLRRLTEAEWVVATPDGDVQVENLADFSIHALQRGAEVGPTYEGNCYMVDAIKESHLVSWHATAARLAAILGPPLPGQAMGRR